MLAQLRLAEEWIKDTLCCSDRESSGAKIDRHSKPPRLERTDCCTDRESSGAKDDNQSKPPRPERDPAASADSLPAAAAAVEHTQAGPADDDLRGTLPPTPAALLPVQEGLSEDGDSAAPSPSSLDASPSAPELQRESSWTTPFSSLQQMMTAETKSVVSSAGSGAGSSAGSAAGSRQGSKEVQTRIVRSVSEIKAEKVRVSVHVDENLLDKEMRGYYARHHHHSRTGHQSDSDSDEREEQEAELHDAHHQLKKKIAAIEKVEAKRKRMEARTNGSLTDQESFRHSATGTSRVSSDELGARHRHGSSKSRLSGGFSFHRTPSGDDKGMSSSRLGFSALGRAGSSFGGSIRKMRSSSGDKGSHSEDPNAQDHRTSKDMMKGSLSLEQVGGGSQSLGQTSDMTSMPTNEADEISREWKAKRGEKAELFQLFKEGGRYEYDTVVPREDMKKKRRNVRKGQERHKAPKPTEYEAKVRGFVEHFDYCMAQKTERQLGAGAAEQDDEADDKNDLGPSAGQIMSDTVLGGILKYLVKCKAAQNFDVMVRKGEIEEGHDQSPPGSSEGEGSDEEQKGGNPDAMRRTDKNPVPQDELAVRMDEMIRKLLEWEPPPKDPLSPMSNLSPQKKNSPRRSKSNLLAAVAPVAVAK